MANNRIKGITIELDGDTRGLDKALSEVNSESIKLQKELKDVNGLLKFNPGNAELIAQKQKILGDQIQNTSNKLKKLQDAQSGVNEQFKKGEISETQYRAFQREIVETEGKLQGFKTELAKTKQSTQDLGKTTQDTGNKLDAYKNDVDGVTKSKKKLAEETVSLGDKIDEAGHKMSTISQAAGGALVGMTGLAVKAGATADDLNTLAKTTGLTTQQIQKLKYGADLVDVSFETIQGSLTKLTRNMSSAQDGTGAQADAFKALGVSIVDANGNLRDNESVFYDAVDALSAVGNETERDALAMELFGKSAQELNPLILGGADALRELGEAAESRGLIISQEELDKANEFNDVLDRVKAEGGQSLMLLGVEIGQALLPVLESLVGVIGVVLEWMRNLDQGTLRVIMTVLAVVAAMAPFLIILGQVAAGISALMTVATALGPVIAVLTGPIGLVIAAIAALIAIGVALYKNWDKIREGAQHLWTAISIAMNYIGDETRKTWDGILKFLSGINLWSIGKNMMQGLINGILGMGGALTGAIGGMVNGAIKGAKKLLGIASPSKVFAEIGEFTGEGLEKGLMSMSGRVARASDRMTQGTIVDAPDFGGPNTPRPSQDQPQGGTGGAGAININIGTMTVRNDEDIQKISRELYALMEREKRGKGGGI